MLHGFEYCQFASEILLFPLFISAQSLPRLLPQPKGKIFSMFAMIKIFPVAHLYDFQEIFSKAPPDIIKQSQDIWGGESEGTVSPSSNDDSSTPPPHI